ncbi:citrate-Mg2+:H+ or citrate-Ca2+:H+ symporter, CitMHS family [Sphingomonas gellani]|uniref:Citrate-Mg2+:H+ or citrate-Ca2+:H+ symporter, CitMHS family n=1 Tax=Sphingomonas gellani TaxID=1166340 RepID=A0A1H8K0Q4_9SPHN|nr:citrate:proton symporter [Sphingomonas gellani]SEN86018.1 citrate-Mg2+:H+ or citrate-Ca2+:H+ symporter, CitMHS family [Sphingomonas gellani]
MLAITGVLAVASLLALILSNRTSPLAALILVPVVAAMAIGAGPAVPAYIVAGIAKIAPVAGMFVFAILFFGIMTDVGLLAPLVSLVLRMVGERPTRIAVGTALLALVIHLDGSGAVCFLVTIPALRPLYDRLGMDRRVLACTASLAAGVNFLPWTGPTLRASASLKVPVGTLFTPMIGVQAAGLAFVFAAAWWLGHREERRLAAGLPLPLPGTRSPGATDASGAIRSTLLHAEDEEVIRLRRPALFPVNVVLTLVVVGVMIAGLVEPVVVFMIGTAVALLINYPDAAEQRARIDAHARAALLMAGILLAAGAFTGIMTGSGMIGAMADAGARHVPDALGSHLPVVVGVLAMPLSLLFDPDSFYFGVLPVIAHVAERFGVEGITIGRAALLGQMTTGFPVSPLTPATFLVAGLSGIELGAHQRFAIPWLFAATLVMVATALLIGVLPL